MKNRMWTVNKSKKSCTVFWKNEMIATITLWPYPDEGKVFIEVQGCHGDGGSGTTVYIGEKK